MPTVSYSTPLLADYAGDTTKAWFVYFDITNTATGECQRKQFRGGINYWHDPADRAKAGEALARQWEKKLKAGWQPSWKVTETGADQFAGMTFLAALDWALKNYRASKPTLRAYRTTIKFLKKASKGLGIDKIKAEDVHRQQIKLLFNYCQTHLGWTNSSFNKNLGYLHALLESLIEWEVLEFNPAHKIKLMPVVETQKYVPLTEEEKKTIEGHLFIHHYAFYVYLMVIYHTGIRPKEVLALRIRDVDLDRRTIKILPDLEEENSKTKKIRHIPINDHLLPFLREMQLQASPFDYFIFGSPYGSNGNRGKGSAAGHVSGASRPDYFRPSPTPIKRDTATRLWKKIVWETLGIEKYQYSLKHTGGDDKILSGMDLDALKELYGHSSKFMTEKYTSKIKDVRRQHIIQHSPAFVPKKE